MKIAELLFGWFGAIFDNELELVSTKQDPPKLRLAVEQDKVESNLGAISFNQRRPDGNHEEYGYVMGRMTADKQGGAVYIAARGADGVTREVAYFDAGHVIFQAPIQAPGLSPGGPAPAILQSADGRVVLAAQNDENLVLYVNGKAVKALHGLPPEQLW